MEPPSIPKIDSLSDRFCEARDAWIRLKQPMIDARDLLEAAMRQENLKLYVYDGKRVELKATEKVKVSPNRNGEEEEDEDDGE